MMTKSSRLYADLKISSSVEKILPLSYKFNNYNNNLKPLIILS